MEEVKAPKTVGTVEERLDELEQKIFRYNTVAERSLDAHHFMNLELEKKLKNTRRGSRTWRIGIYMSCQSWIGIKL